MKTLLRILLILALIGIIAILLNVYNATSAQQEVLEERPSVVEFENMEAMTVNSRLAVLPGL